MRTMMIAAACLALSPALAQAQEADPMAAAFGNTIMLAIEPAWHARQYIDPDGTWRQVADDGEVKGSWKRVGGQSCMTQTEPPGPTYCNPLTPHKIGDSWTNTDKDTGATVVITLVAGRP